METNIIDFKEKKIVGLKKTFKISNNEIPQLWEDYMKRFGEIKNLTEERVCYGVCFPMQGNDFNDETPFEYMAGTPVNKFDQIPENMIAHTIPSGRYVSFIHKGSLDNLRETYNYIYREWADKTKYELDNRDQLEVYDHRFKFGHPDSIMEILVPIK